MRTQILLEAEKDLRDEIKMRIRQRDSYFTQTIAFCGALLTFGLATVRGFTGIATLLCGPFVALTYWRFLMNSFSIHDRAKLYLLDVEARLDEIVNGDAVEGSFRADARHKDLPEYKSWQRYCNDSGLSTTDRSRKSTSCTMILGSVVVFGSAIALRCCIDGYGSCGLLVALGSHCVASLIILCLYHCMVCEFEQKKNLKTDREVYRHGGQAGNEHGATDSGCPSNHV